MQDHFFFRIQDRCGCCTALHYIYEIMHHPRWNQLWDRPLSSSFQVPDPPQQWNLPASYPMTASFFYMPPTQRQRWCMPQSYLIIRRICISSIPYLIICGILRWVFLLILLIGSAALWFGWGQRY